MKKLKQLIVITAIFVLTLPTVILADSIPESFSVRGNVTTDGQDAEIGTIISVEKDNKEIAVTTVTIEGKYLVEISAENKGETLIYKTDGFPSISEYANPTGIPSSQDIDLVFVVATEPAPASNPTPGGSGGGGTAVPAEGTSVPASPVSEETPKIPVIKGVTTVNIFDGDIIVNPNAEGLARFDVYIVKIVGDKKFRRLILSPHVFESYGHLKWENIKEINQETMNNFAISNLVRCQDPNFGVNDPKVYQLTPNGDKGTKRWMNMSAKAFQSAGHNWNAIYIINKIDRDAYAMGEEII